MSNLRWQELNLNENYIESEGFNDIIYALRENNSLKRLSIAYNFLDGESVICMIVNYDSIQLEELDISGNKIHYSIVFVFLKEMKHCKLRKLSFCDLDNHAVVGGGAAASPAAAAVAAAHIHDQKFVINCESL